MRLRRSSLKVVRDIRRSRWQFLAAATVIALGVAIFISSYSSYQNLRTSYDRTYDELGMANFWFRLDNAPLAVVDSMQSEDGVAAAEGRLVADLPIILPESGPNRILGRMVSIPGAESGRRASVNDVKLTDGSYPSTGEVLLERSFADFNDVKPGDRLELRLPDGRSVDFRVAGAAASPEYLWVARSEQDIFTPPANFGIVFIPYENLAGLVGAAGTVNDIAVRLDPGADNEATAAATAAVLAPYGPFQVTDREHQISNRLLQLDLDGFRSLALVFPILFLTVSALAIYSLLNRLVQTQRGQIGVMRAIGYSRRQMVRHYLGFGALIGAAGATAGVVIGFVLSVLLTEAYAWFLHVPFVAVRFQPLVIAIALAAGLSTALTGAAATAWAAARVQPADAMRPPVPPAGRRTILEVLLPPLARLPSVVKLPLRGVFRAPRRTVYTACGVAAGVALTLVAASFLDSYNRAISVQFDRIQNYDARLNFTAPFPTNDLAGVASSDGVIDVEPIAETPVQLSSNGRTHHTLLRGLEADGELLRTYAPSGERERPGDGILITEPVRDILLAGVGDEIEVQALVGDAPPMRLRVDGIVQQPLGDIAFSRLDTAQSLGGSPGLASALFLTFPGEEPDPQTESALLNLPGAANLELTKDLRDYVSELSRLFLVFVVIMLGFGVALGLTIIFNTVTINVLERQRELATMRTLGMGIRRIGSMVTIENLLMGLLGAVLGMPIGYGLAIYFSSLYQNELFDMPLVINDSTYGIAAVAAIITLVLAEIPAIRYIRGLDLPAVVREMAT